MVVSIFSEFFGPLIRSGMEDPEDRREAARQYLRDREEKADFYKEWFRTSRVPREEFRKATNLARYYEESDPTSKYLPGRRHEKFVLDEDAPFHFNRRF